MTFNPPWGWHVPADRVGDAREVLVETFADRDPIAKWIFHEETNADALSRRYFRNMFSYPDENCIWLASSPAMELVSVWMPPACTGPSAHDFDDPDPFVDADFAEPTTQARMNGVDELEYSLKDELTSTPNWCA